MYCAANAFNFSLLTDLKQDVAYEVRIVSIDKDERRSHSSWIKVFPEEGKKNTKKTMTRRWTKRRCMCFIFFISYLTFYQHIYFVYFKEILTWVYFEANKWINQTISVHLVIDVNQFSKSIQLSIRYKLAMIFMSNREGKTTLIWSLRVESIKPGQQIFRI